ncbi:MAG: hypothetical protein K2Q21_07470 [Chitinophagaceae bacterium]|nr:hypothetical protein [Chitinophagaceae bacterium]
MRQIEVIVLLTFLMILYSCHDKQISGYDPCAYAKPFSGGFSILQEVGDTLIEADTVFLNSYIHLIPLGKDIDSMKWQLGYYNAPFVRNSEVRQFISGNLDQFINVNLMVFRHPNLQCFPNDSAINIYGKRFYITDIGNSLLKGVYKGALIDNLKDSFSISIKYLSSPLPYYFLANLPKGCTRSVSMAGYPSDIGYPISVGYRSFHIDGGSCLPNIFGNGILAKNDSLKITYWYHDSTNVNLKIYKTFIGKKIS